MLLTFHGQLHLLYDPSNYWLATHTSVMNERKTHLKDVIILKRFKAYHLFCSCKWVICLLYWLRTFFTKYFLNGTIITYSHWKNTGTKYYNSSDVLFMLLKCSASFINHHNKDIIQILSTADSFWLGYSRLLSWRGSCAWHQNEIVT